MGLARATRFALLLLLSGGQQLPAQNEGKRLPVPSDAAQAATTEAIREVYKSEYASATRPETKRVLAAELLTDALATKDAADRYVLLRIARDVAVQAGDLDLARRAIERQATEFEVDSRALHLEALEKVTDKALVSELSFVVGAAIRLVDDLVRIDRYAEALRASEAALVAARRSKDAALLKRATVLHERTAGLVKAYDAVAEAFQTLETSPTDPDANAAVGAFLTLGRGDWKRGIPMLALGSDDDPLALLARQELAAETADAKLDLADRWVEAAEKRSAHERAAFRRHAYDLYLASQPGLNGLTARRVAVRLDELEREMTPDTLSAPAVKVLQEFRGHRSGAFSADSRYLITSGPSGTLHLWNVATFREVRQFHGHEGDVRGLQVFADGKRLLSVGNDKKARLWEVATGAEIRSFPTVQSCDWCTLSNDGKRCYLGHGSRVWSYDIERGRELRTWDVSGGQGDVQARAVSGDGRFAISSGLTNTVRVFDLVRGSHVSFNGQTHCYNADLSGDGRLAASCGGDTAVRIWNVATRTMVAALQGANNAHYYTVRLSPDSTRVLVGGSDSAAHLWDLRTGEKLHTWQLNQHQKYQAFSPDGRYAVSCSWVHGVALLGLPD